MIAAGEKLLVNMGAMTVVVADAVNPARLPEPVAVLFFTPTVPACTATLTMHVAGKEPTAPPLNEMELNAARYA